MAIVQSAEGSVGPITRSLSARLVVLVVEESADEASRITTELERSGYTVAAEQVRTAEHLAAALDKGSWDVVISSSGATAAVDGVAVVQALRERQLETPVVFLTDGADEFTNLESIAAGAEDVLKREDLYRLPYVVGRILQHQQIRQDQASMLRTGRLKIHRRRGFGVRGAFAGVLAALALALIAFSVWLGASGRMSAEARLQARIEEGAGAVALLAQQVVGTGGALSNVADPAALHATLAAFALAHGREIQIVDSNQHVFADSTSAHVGQPVRDDLREQLSEVIRNGQARTFSIESGREGAPAHFQANPIQAKNGSVIGAVLIDYTTERVELGSEVSRQVRAARLLAGTICLAVFTCLVLGVFLYVVRPIERLRDVAARLSSGSLDLDVPRGPAEIGDIGVGIDTLRKRLKKSVLARQSDMVQRLRAEEALRQLHLRLRDQIDATQSRAREFTLLAQMGALLQACATREESFRIISRFAAELFPRYRGAVYLSGATRELFEPVACWGSSDASRVAISTQDCWALRRGQAHVVRASGHELRCSHMDAGEAAAATLCVPLMAQASAIGVLCLRHEESGSFSEAASPPQALAEAASEQISLSLANLMLREELHELSIADPLTGLHNRRFLVQALTHEIERAARQQAGVGVVIADIDFFKRINDRFGHDGGDALLKAVAQELRNAIRGGDIACRMGGEEFAILLPGASFAIARQRAEELRHAIAALKVHHLDVVLPSVSLSCGVAIYPEHGSTVDTLLRSADQALYRAKEGGRNRVESAAA
jgi:diguanylate cyclase (GGDEF)-like protein